MEKVSAVECNSYELEEVFQSVKEALDRIGFVIPVGKTVLIKPNILAQNQPEQHSITHYSIVDGLCRLLKEKNCRILIGESGAFYQKGLTAKGFQTSRIAETARKYDAVLLAFEEHPMAPIPSGLPGPHPLLISKAVLEADLVINACKLKTHSSMRFSGAVKNMFGCVPGGYKQKIHMLVDSELELAGIFIDIHESVRPALNIMDGVFSLDGGPSAIGKPVKTSRIFASTNAAALDAVAAGMIGYKPEDIPALVIAKSRGLIDNYDEIQILGDIVQHHFKHITTGGFGLKYDKGSIFVKDTYVDLRIDSSKCTRCGKCASACPVLAITDCDGVPAIDKSKCISCYYCLSLCPVKAVRTDLSAMNRLIGAIRYILRI